MGRRVAVLGCGNMGKAIVRGLVASGWTRDIVATNPHAHKAEALSTELGVPCITSNVEAARGADVVILGVKPQIMKSVLTELAGAVTARQLVISIAAGVPTRVIEKALQPAAKGTGAQSSSPVAASPPPVVRSMPNLAVTVRAGATAIAPGLHARPGHVATARAIFESVGLVEEVPEPLLDAVTGLSGTGPMYVFQVIEALSDGGVKVGLSRDVASRLAMQTVVGSALLARQSGLHPAALKDQVTSPRGTAIAALHVLHRNAFAAILMDAVEAAAKRSHELGLARSAEFD